MAAIVPPDLIKVTEIFLVPSSFLVAALGAADTNAHRAAVSLLGLIVCCLWLLCSQEAMSEHEASQKEIHKPISSLRIKILSRMSWVFIAGWLISTVVHVVLWQRPLGT